jgi:hypothetical protein
VSKDQIKKNEALHETYKKKWISEKKSGGTWLSKKEYERKTGKPGQA